MVPTKRAVHRQKLKHSLMAIGVVGSVGLWLWCLPCNCHASTESTNTINMVGWRGWQTELGNNFAIIAHSWPQLNIEARNQTQRAQIQKPHLSFPRLQIQQQSAFSHQIQAHTHDAGTFIGSEQTEQSLGRTSRQSMDWQDSEAISKPVVGKSIYSWKSHWKANIYSFSSTQRTHHLFLSLGTNSFSLQSAYKINLRALFARANSRSSRGHYLINMPPLKGAAMCVFELQRRAKQAICLSWAVWGA